MDSFALYFTAALIILMTGLLAFELFNASIIVFSTLLMLIFSDVITVDEAFAGFSNHGMLTVAFLFVIARTLETTGILNSLGNFVLGKTGSVSKKLIRLLFPVSALSAFFNNTPIVAMLIPVIGNWTKKNNLSISKFLIPLSYAAILGGTCTLIGTSTNLVVHGLMLEHGLEGMKLFEISKVGVPLAIIGIMVITLIGHRFLPNRKEPVVELGESTREFVVTMKVLRNYPHIGETIEKAGLRHLKGLFLFQIQRQGETITSVSPQEIIHKGDRLFFTGLPQTIVELQRTAGLSLLKEETFDLKNYDSDKIGIFEVVISQDSPLTGKGVRESAFRSHYDAVILAVHRAGERIRQKIGDIILHSGDTLLILSEKKFLNRWYHSKDFYLVSKSAEIFSKPKRYSYFSLFVLVGMICMMALNSIPILVSVSVAATILLLSKSIKAKEAIESIDWHVLLVIAAAFGIAKGVENSGLSFVIAEKIKILFNPLGTLGLITGIYFLTSIYTEIITNNAAAALVFPIALSTAQQAGVDPRPLLIVVAIAGSASFATPIGYQTNLMVYGPGGYRFKDFLKIGIPMNIFIGILTITFVYLLNYR